MIPQITNKALDMPEYISFRWATSFILEGFFKMEMVYIIEA